MGLGHADRQVAEALPLVPLDLGHCLRQQFDVSRSVNLLRDCPDFVLDGQVKVVEEAEVARRLSCSLDSLGKVDSTSATLGPVAAENCIKGSCFFRICLSPKYGENDSINVSWKTFWCIYA